LNAWNVWISLYIFVRVINKKNEIFGIVWSVGLNLRGGQ